MSSVLTIFSSEQPVLVIDDCPMYRTAAKGMLLKLGFDTEQLHLASDASSALACCRSHQFQLVLCDYNLGAKTNGHQLLDQLIHDRMLPADCVIIVVTGDASSSVVRGFAELEPDGYLVKPLNFNTLRTRLPKLGRRKRALGKVLHSFAGGDYQQVLEQADEALCSANEMTHSAQMLKAKALIELGHLDDARNILITLNPGPEPTRVTLELARVAKLQKHYKTSQLLLNQIKSDAIYCGDVLQLSAELDLLQGQFDTEIGRAHV